MSEKTVKELEKEIKQLRLELSMEQTHVKMAEDELSKDIDIRWARSLDMGRTLDIIRDEVGPLSSDADQTLVDQIQWMCGSHHKYVDISERQDDEIKELERRLKFWRDDVGGMYGLTAGTFFGSAWTLEMWVEFEEIEPEMFEEKKGGEGLVFVERTAREFVERTARERAARE